MADDARFEPILQSHAIERCSAVVVFDQPVPDKVFARVRSDAEGRLRQAGFAEVNPGLGVQIDMTTGRVGPAKGVGPVQFTTADRGLTIVMMPNAVIWQTSRYVRWDPFIGQFESLVMPLVTAYSDVVSGSAIQLDYLDRFFWTGDWESFDIERLIQLDSGMIASRASKADREWHSHSGWFEHHEDGVRRLVNANIDVVEQSPPPGTHPMPSVGIYTMVQDQISATAAPEILTALQQESPIERLEKQHKALKRLLSEIIIPAMSDQIGLNSKVA
jgi:uncharacterized protein (TIGR04255 family)